MQKEFEKLQIRDDFIFGIIMRNKTYCKTFLETVLGIAISRIEYPQVQETIDLSKDAKGVRLDVYVEGEEETVYNIEIQTTKIILNTKGARKDVSPEMKNLLDYIDGKIPKDDFTKKLEEEVKNIRANKKFTKYGNYKKYFLIAHEERKYYT